MQSFEVLEQAYEAKRKKDILSNIFYGVVSLLIVLLAIFIYQKYRNFTAVQQLSNQNIQNKTQQVPAAKVSQNHQVAKAKSPSNQAVQNKQLMPNKEQVPIAQNPAKQQPVQTSTMQAPKTMQVPKQEQATLKPAQKVTAKTQITNTAVNPKAVAKTVQTTQQPTSQKAQTTASNNQSAKPSNSEAAQVKPLKAQEIKTLALAQKPKSQAEVLPQAKSKTNQTATVKQAKTEKKVQKPAFNLSIQTNTKITTTNLIARFNLKKDYKNAMKVADAFFINKNYQKASDWALRANNLDKYQERSWLLFAKSQVALKNVEVAKAALQSFLRMRNSERILLYYKKISRQ